MDESIANTKHVFQNKVLVFFGPNNLLMHTIEEKQVHLCIVALLFWVFLTRNTDHLDDALRPQRVDVCLIIVSPPDLHASSSPLGFRRKEFRGKLAIAITANFINRNTTAEAKVEEISGVAFIFNQKFFQDLREATGVFQLHCCRFKASVFLNEARFGNSPFFPVHPIKMLNIRFDANPVKLLTW